MVLKLMTIDWIYIPLCKHASIDCGCSVSNAAATSRLNAESTEDGQNDGDCQRVGTQQMLQHR